MSTVRVSLLMPAYNAERFIDAALASLLAETDVPLEILVIDDGSTDSTAGVVEACSIRDPRVRLLSMPHRGMFFALNSGLDEARGDYVTFLDSDDLCPPGRIARQVAKLDAAPAAGAVVGEVLVFEALTDAHEPLPGSRWARILGPCLGAGTFRRAAVEAVGRFDETFSHSGDIDFLLRLHDSEWPLVPERDLALLCRKHAGNMSSEAGKVQSFLLKALQRSIARRRRSGRLNDIPPFALMKPLDQLESSDVALPGHRTARPIPLGSGE